MFVSSVIQGFEEYREAAAAAIQSLRHTATRAEDFGAMDSAPQAACLAGVRGADVVVLLLGERYGARQASGLSATHEEYREARERTSVLAFLQSGVNFEEQQAEFVSEVQDWSSGLLVARFSDPDGLRNEVTSAIRDLELAQAVRPFDEHEALQRALEAAPKPARTTHPRLEIVCASGPNQNILRPSQLDDNLADELQQEAVFGPNGVLDRRSATEREVKGDWLWLRQDDGDFGLSQLGTIVLALPAIATDSRGTNWPLAVIEEDVQRLIERGLRFSAWVLDKVDPLSRLSHSVVVVGLLNADYLGWMTQAEADEHPNSVSIGLQQQEPPFVQLSPPSRRRQEVGTRFVEIAEDLTVLLKRKRGR